MIYKAALKEGKVSEESTRSKPHKLLTKLDSCISDIGEPAPAATSMAENDVIRPRRRAQTEGSRTMMAMKRTKRKKHKVTANTLFAIIIFSEFLKELAAISLEHSVASFQYLHEYTHHSNSV